MYNVIEFDISILICKLMRFNKTKWRAIAKQSRKRKMFLNIDLHQVFKTIFFSRSRVPKEMDVFEIISEKL